MLFVFACLLAAPKVILKGIVKFSFSVKSDLNKTRCQLNLSDSCSIQAYKLLC